LVSWVYWSRSRLVTLSLLAVAGVLLCLAGEVAAHSGTELAVATILLTVGTIVLTIGLTVLAAMLIFRASLHVAKRLASKLVNRSPATARRVATALVISALIMAVALGLLLLTWALTGDPGPFVELSRILSTALPRHEIPWLTIYVLASVLTMMLLGIPMVLPIVLALLTAIATSMMIARRTATTPRRVAHVA
jgi:hypothetical protein